VRVVKTVRKAAGRAIKALAKPFRACLRPPRVEEGRVADVVDVVDVRRDAVIATDVVMPPKVTEEVMDDKAQLALYQQLKEIDAAVDEVGKVIYELIKVVVEEVLDDWDREGVIDMDWEPNMELVEKIYDIYQPETYSEPTVGAEPVGEEPVDASFLSSNQEPTKIEKASLVLSEDDEQPDTPTVDDDYPRKLDPSKHIDDALSDDEITIADDARDIETLSDDELLDWNRDIRHWIQFFLAYRPPIAGIFRSALGGETH